MVKIFKKRILFTVFIVLFTVFALLSCGKYENPPAVTEDEDTSIGIDSNSDSDSDVESDPPVTENVLTITKENSSEFVIVRPEKAGASLREAATSLYRAFGASGFSPDFISDFTTDPTSISPDSKEILIGVTNRPESAEFSQGLLTDDYTIISNGKKLIIVGGSEDATVKAINGFIMKYLTSPVDSLSFKAGEFQTFHEKYEIDSLTLYGEKISDFVIVCDKSSNIYANHAAKILCERIAEKTGINVNIVTDATQKHEYEIRIDTDAGKTSSLAENEYSYKKDGKSLNILGTPRSILFAVREILEGMSDGKLEPENEGTFCLKSENYPNEPTLEGRIPVALCDQKNKSVVVVDLNNPNPTSSDAIIWSWSPNKNTNGSSGQGFSSSIDEAKLRYSPVLQKYVVCMTSSAGYMGVVEYPSGKVLWEVNAKGYGPHSIEYLPSGLVVCALSGNTDYSKGNIRVYGVSQTGIPKKTFASKDLYGAHGVIWDDELGVLWALSNTEIVAYEIGGTLEDPTLTRISTFGTTIPGGGHDMSTKLGNPNKILVTSNSIYEYDKFRNTLTDVCALSPELQTPDIKSIGVFSDGTVVRAAATEVFKAHDTDTLAVFTLNSQSVYEKKEYVFQDRAFYKARIFLPYYI